MFQITRRTLYNWVEQGKFPQPIQVLATSRWDVRDIEGPRSDNPSVSDTQGLGCLGFIGCWVIGCLGCWVHAIGTKPTFSATIAQAVA